MSHFFLLLNSSIAITLFILGLVTLINDRRNVLNWLFFSFTTCVAVWLISAAVSNDTGNSATVSLHGNYLVFFFSYFTSYALLWFATLITTTAQRARGLRLATIPLIIIGFISASPLVVAGVENHGSVYAVIFGPLVVLYALALIAMLLGAIIVLARASQQKNLASRKRNQINTLLRSLLIAVPILLVTQFIMPAVTGSFEITNIGILIMILPVISLYISVIRHGLFDIRLVAVRAVAYILSLVVLAVVYYVFAYALSHLLFSDEANTQTMSPLNVGLALALAFIFQPVKRFFDKFTNFFFFRSSYDTNEFFSRFTKRLSATTDLYDLLHYTVSEISTTLNASYGAFLVYNSEGRMAFVSTDKKYKSLPVEDAAALDEYVKTHGNGVVLTHDLTYGDKEHVRRILKSHKIEVLLPIVQSGTVMGYLYLGESLGSHYSSRDMGTLTTIVDELMIAIQNTLTVEQIKELNAHLEQRIESATKELRRSNAQLQKLDEAKDDFISMASHQLRTPLTSIKGYISMMMEGDVGKITREQQNVLNEAFMSSERMVRLISDFLNVSRLQTGKFVIEKHAVDLSLLVQREIESLRPNAMARNMSFVYKAPKNILPLEVDENKIQQVVMNFLDNALYYSKDDGKITVTLKKASDSVELVVKDSGIGVPESEQVHLFNKFFRATNARRARPDGTGVGLFLAKKVIDAHDGEIIFESVEGKGSSFGFRLPLPK